MARNTAADDSRGSYKNLRMFDDWSDLAANATEEEIVFWVNRLYHERTTRSASMKRVQERNKILLRTAKQLLDSDEYTEVLKRAAAAAEADEL